MTTGKHLGIALTLIGCVVVGFGQACSSSGGGRSTSSLSSSSSDGQPSLLATSTLTIAPTMQQVAHDSVTPLTATGGVMPYIFSLSSGGGTIISKTGVFTAPNQDAVVSIHVTDALGAAGDSLLLVSGAPTSTTVAGTFSKVFQGSFDAMNALVSGCNQVNPKGAECNLAIHKTCVANGYGEGFGPLEHLGDLIVYACVTKGAFSERPVNFSALSFYQPSCTEANAMSDACASAISRYCIAAGSVGGYGPVANDTRKAIVACMFTHADVRLKIPFASLTATVSSCTNETAFTDNCLTAVHRYCKNQGYISGYGISEHGAGSATIDCVN